MDFFGEEFENEQSQTILNDIIDKVSNYDIYDFISRVAGLNLMSENQNKSVLLDTLLQYLLSHEESVYKSVNKMSAGKFKVIINELNSTFLSASVDPCENTFVQNVMFSNGNYRVFNGIDAMPAYNLQSLIRVLFQYQNQFDENYLKKVYRLFSFILGLSEEIAKKLGIDVRNIKYDEQHMVILLSNDDVKKYAEQVSFPLDRVEHYIYGYFKIDDMLKKLMVLKLLI